MYAYVESQQRYYNTPAAESLAVLFCVLGAGQSLDSKGYFPGNYKSKDVVDFGPAVPLKNLYPWSPHETHRPYANLAGCRDVGFREAVEYFLACLSITPDTARYASEWKLNIPEIRRVLLDTPTIVDEYDSANSMSQFVEKLAGNSVCTGNNPVGNTSTTHKNSVRQVWFFDVQWTDCPKFVEDEVRDLWGTQGLGNDNFFYRATVDNDLFDRYPNIYFWLKHKGIPDYETVLVHWWW